MIPGIAPVISLAASGGGFAFKSSSTSNTQTIAWPGGIASGDLAVLVEMSRSTTGPISNSTPSGFTNQYADAIGSFPQPKFMVHTKVCAGSETGNITGIPGSHSIGKVLLIFSGGISTVTRSSTWSYVFEFENPSAQSVTASGGTPPLVVIGAASSESSTPSFSTASPAFDGEITATNLRVGYKVYSSAPSNHSVDMDDLGNQNVLSSGWFEAN